MKVLYDHQIFESQKFGGISRYFFELMNSYSKNNLLEWACPVIYSGNEYIKKIPYFSNRILPFIEKKNPLDSFLGGKSFRGKKRIYQLKKILLPETPQPDHHALNKAALIETIKGKNYDILHPTYYDEYILDCIDDKPFVLTVYDMIHQVFPEYFYRGGIDKTRKLLEQATKIIAISHSTKSDIVNILGIPEEKISVVYLANSLAAGNLQTNNSFKSLIPEKFFLFVGQRGEYKNFLFFAQMFAAVTYGQSDIYIVCTGQPFDGYETRFLKKLGISHLVIQFFVSDVQLAYLYQHAIALVFASLYEGFGLPLLESFSAGCPVVVSKTSSLEEIGADAVIYFEPKNPASLLHALEQALHNSQLLKENISKGYARLKDFSWDKTAVETRRVYESVLKT